MFFGDLELHGHFDIFSLWCKVKCSCDEFNNQSHILQPGPWDNFIVRGVNNPLISYLVYLFGGSMFFGDWCGSYKFEVNNKNILISENKQAEYVHKTA